MWSAVSPRERTSPRRVREYIDGRLGDNISLDALAEVAELSRCHFARAFKQSVGTSPHAFVMQRRLERAEHLLAETDLSLCQVALDSGFSDQSHFSSCFRRSFGESPRSFRRSRR
jgi:AraC family transcriptional regulator